MWHSKIGSEIISSVSQLTPEILMVSVGEMCCFLLEKQSLDIVKSIKYVRGEK